MSIHSGTSSEIPTALRFHPSDTTFVEAFDSMSPLAFADVLDRVRQIVAKTVSSAPAPAALQPPAQARPSGGLSPTALRRVRAYVEDHIAERFDMDVLADIAGLSTCHFSRAFKQSLGLPPYNYVVKRRVATAAELIEQTDRPLVDVAQSVGFSDQSHFTRSFVRIVGETPRAFRRRNR